MTLQTVNSETGGQEGVWIAAICTLILCIGWILLPHNQAVSTHKQVASYQVSIKELGNKPLAMIADLRLAHEEISHLYEQQDRWPSVVQLEGIWLAPFVKDKSWLHQGQHHWKLLSPGFYQGVPSIVRTDSLDGNDGMNARYILNSTEAAVDIWIDLHGSAVLFQTHNSSLNPTDNKPMQSSELIKAGWKQVAFAADVTETDH